MESMTLKTKSDFRRQPTAGLCWISCNPIFAHVGEINLLLSEKRSSYGEDYIIVIVRDQYMFKLVLGDNVYP